MSSVVSEFDFSARPRVRRPSLTPLVDVVFLLLVFFMLAARFGGEVALPLDAANGGADAWVGPPRLIELGERGVRLNGSPIALADLAPDLAPLMPGLDAPVVLRAGPGADAQLLAEVLARLSAAGYARLILLD